MSAINISIRYDLGIWNLERRHSKIQVKLKLVEDIHYTFFVINPHSGSFDLKKDPSYTLNPSALENSYLVSDYVLKTRSSSLIHTIFIPQRTHTLKELALDLFFPLTRRYISNISQNNHKPTNVCKIVSTVLLIAVDLFTFIFRFFALIPRVIYNSTKDVHPLQKCILNQHNTVIYTPEDNTTQSPDSDLIARDDTDDSPPPKTSISTNTDTEIPKDSEALIISCEKKWQLIEETSDGSTTSLKNACTMNYFWRIDFYSPLQSSLLWEGVSYDLDSNYSTRRLVFPLQDTKESFYSQFYQYSDNSKALLSDELKKFCEKPKVTFL